MSKARILAVDDQRYFRELIEGLLDDEGYVVQTTSSGEEALHILEREDFDVIITDLVMPGIDGSELVRLIKERRPEQDVVMVTGVVDVKTAVDAMKQGATDYIIKPFDRTALTDSIEKILKQRRLRDEHSRLMDENLEFMGVLSLFERASGLFSMLSVEPLAERLLDGLCLETRAQSGILWAAEDPGMEMLELVGARGLVRVDGEPGSVQLADAEAAWCPGLSDSCSVLAAMPEDVHGVEALYLPIRAEGVTLGIVRLSDKLDGAQFDGSDRSVAEKFCEFGGVAIRNAMRFRALERRSLRDPETRAYSQAYFEDAARNEIQKANRFGYRFSILRVEIEGWGAADAAVDGPRTTVVDREVVEAARRVEGALRATDLLATGDDGAFLLLLPQTDALGAGVLAQRIRAAFVALWEGREAPIVRFAATTFPVDGTQLESLERVLDQRIADSHESLLVERPEFARPQALDPLLDRMLEIGTIEPIEAEGQILRFVLEDVLRRPSERGVLFLSPGLRWLPDVLDALEEIQGQVVRAEIILLAEGEERDPHPQVTLATKSGLDSRRPFAVYFGDGPAYAMVGQVTQAASKAAIFQTADRPLVEHLAFELQRELGIVLSV
jgi:FixJ family two-component response regulator/GGDEF domain-containing protein